MRGVSRILVLTMGLACPVSLLAAPPAQSAPADTTAQTAPTFTIDQVVTDTVADAWRQGGKTETGFFAIVKTMAQFAAEKRALTLPDSQADGRRMGLYIKQQARLDHQQLLYPIVDKAVRMVGKPAPADTSTAAPAPQQ